MPKKTTQHPSPRYITEGRAKECPVCDTTGSLVKQLTDFTSGPLRAKPRGPRVGEVTEQFIEDSRAELQQQKEELKNKC